jgi:predicted O-methyltransferase YrrM
MKVVGVKEIEMRPSNTFLHTGFIKFVEYLKSKDVKRILEIGAFKGESTVIFKEILGEDSVVITIDPFQRMFDKNDVIDTQDLTLVEQVFNSNTLDHENIGKMKFYSQDISDMFADGYFDAIYVDGLHTYNQVRLDINKYKSKVKSGGLITGHDRVIPVTQDQLDLFYHPEGALKMRELVTSAVIDELQITETELIKFDDTSWVYQTK